MHARGACHAHELSLLHPDTEAHRKGATSTPQQLISSLRVHAN